MINWIIYQIPWEWKLGFWLIVGLGIAGVVLHFFGVKWGAIVAGALAVIAAAASIYNRGQQSGYNARKTQEKDAIDAQQNHWDQIDAKPLDPAAAYDELRHRVPPAGK